MARSSSSLSKVEGCHFVVKIVAWSDEKVLQVECHRQNARVIISKVGAPDTTLRPVRHQRNPSSVMVSGAMALGGQRDPSICFPSQDNTQLHHVSGSGVGENHGLDQVCTGDCHVQTK